MMKYLLLSAASAASNSAAVEGGIQLSFSPEAFLKSLPMMGKGMLGIFVVIVVIYLVIMLFNKAFKPKKKGE